MIRNFKIRLALSLVLFIFTCSDVLALGGNEHSELWNDVFGVNDKV